MMRALLDTNILVDYLNGIAAAKKEIARHEHASISIVTWMEVLIGTVPEEEKLVRGFLQQFELFHIDLAIAELVVALRRQHRIRLPDAIIWATAKKHNILLITRNTKDFSKDEPGIRVPYSI